MTNPRGKIEFDKLRVELWVSGTAGEDGNGGYCAMLHSVLDGTHYKKTIAGHGKDTTPTRMTLKAILEGLLQIKQKSFVHIYVGIPQVSAGINKHMHTWAKNDFKLKGGGQLQHEDLYRQIHALLTSKTLNYKVHYMGNSPDPENNIMVIHTASQYAQKAKKMILETSIS